MVVRAVLLTVLSLGCSSMPEYVHAPVRASSVDDEPLTESEAFRELASPKGPPRFARVSENLYRGGQPSKRNLELLRSLGVTTVINLRREDESTWRAEEAEALRLGMHFMHFPFYGIFGADKLFVERILSEMKKGHVYIHCKNGRDRTSLMVALYRVLEEDWDPHVAWKLEAINYGSAQTFFYRQLHVTFARMVKTRQVAATR
jgi:protein tyrosine phosphatase (PTP) superfamily phosphohydrolase (DUF442 family)